MSDKRIAYNAQRRLAVIDQYISSGTYPTASFLADILECSVRTVQRDIKEMILFYQAPIEAKKRGGRILLFRPDFLSQKCYAERGRTFFYCFI